jgi:hypothetical protein
VSTAWLGMRSADQEVSDANQAHIEFAGLDANHDKV